MHAPKLARHLAVVAVIALLLGPLSVSLVLSAVTIAGFEVEAGEEEIFVYWETASEIGNLGFYVWRSENPDTGYVRLPLDAPSEQFIPSEDFGVGAFYEYMDTEIVSGVLYYYKVQDVPANGSPGEMVGPESAGIDLTPDPTTPPPTTPPTDTDTATPTATSTATPSSSQATDTPAPEASVRFWAEETSLSAGECTTVQWIANNVRSVFFDGGAATGQGARTYCPCEDETHTLRVTYRDGTSEAFVVELSVSGSCNGALPNSSLSPLATPTRRPSTGATATLRPTATPQPTIAPTVVRQPSATPRSRHARPTPTGLVPPTTDMAVARNTGTDVVEMVASPTVSAVSQSPTPADPASGDGIVVEGLPASRSIPAGLLLVAAAVTGIGLVSAGIWLWRRG